MTYTYGVAIPTNGNGEYLREVLESLAGLPTPPQTVAINDQSCGTDVAGICEEYTERFPTLVRTTRTDPPGAASSRNEAIAAIVQPDKRIIFVGSKFYKDFLVLCNCHFNEWCIFGRNLSLCHCIPDK